MEDDEGPKNAHASSSSPQQYIGLTIQDEPLDTVEVDDAVTNTEQCELVHEPGDSQPLVSSSPIQAQNDDAAAEENHDSVSAAEETEASELAVSDSRFGDDKEVEVGGTETETEMEIPTDCARRLDGEAVEAEAEGEVSMETVIECEVKGVDESRLVGGDSPNANEVAAAGEVPPVGFGMDWENENRVETEFVGEVESSVGQFVSELDDSQLLGVEGGVTKLDDVESTNVDVVEVGAGKVLGGGVEKELGNEVATKEFVSGLEDSRLLVVEGGALKCEPGLDESELADVKSPIAGEVVVVDGSMQGGQ